MNLDKPKQPQWKIGELVELDEEYLEQEIIAGFKEIIGEGPYRVHAFDRDERGTLDGLIVSGSEPVVVPPHVTDLSAFFNMEQDELSAYLASGKELVKGLLSLPAEILKKFKLHS